MRLAEEYARAVKSTEGNAVFLFPDFSIPELIAFCNIATERVGGLTVALSGTDGDYKYVISSFNEELSTRAREINSALDGRGGGRGGMIQGSFRADYESITAFFGK
jgi:alanyl-tRNA synthetase